MSQWTKLVVPIAQSEAVMNKLMDENLRLVLSGKLTTSLGVYCLRTDGIADNEVYYFAPSAYEVGFSLGAESCDKPDDSMLVPALAG